MKRVLLGILSIIPSIIIALVMWIIFLPKMLWEIPKDNYYRIAYNKIWVKVRENENGTYTVIHHGQEKTFTKEEYEEKILRKNSKKATK